MFGKRCQLCGGKLDHNICTLCGLDNSKSDKNYKLNQNSCDGEPLTHVHEEAKPKARSKANATPRKTQQPRVQRTPVRPGKKKNPAGKVIAIITVLGILFNLAEPFLDEMSLPDSFGELVGVAPEKELYSNVTYELAEEGERWEDKLVQGEYVVGVHIPEGTYRAEIEESVSFNLNDDENGIYMWDNSFEYEGGRGKEIEDIRCYEGARIKVIGTWLRGVSFYSENAQVASMTGLENPLTETVVVKNGDVAGTDFPAGTYDIVMSEGESDFSYIVPGTVIDDQEDDYVNTTDSMWISTFDEEFVYRNLYLPEGTEIMIDGDDVTLVPSEVILPDYEGYYYMYE